MGLSGALRCFFGGWEKGLGWSVVLDGEPGPFYDAVGRLLFTPDGKRFAYTASREGGWQVVADGQLGPQYQGVGYLAFSPDGARVAHAARGSGR